MPTVVLASSKGGSTKTTTNLIIGLQLAKKGFSVCYVDADAEEHLTDWASLPGKPENVSVVNGVNEDTIIDVIAEQNEKYDFVLVDLEGTASLMVAHAVAMADFVVIPCQASRMDARCAKKTIKMIKNQSRLLKRPIPFAVLFTRTPPPDFETKVLKNIRNEMLKANVPIFKRALQEWAVYRDVLDFGGMLEDMDPKKSSNLPKAIENGDEVVGELVAFMTQD